MAARKKQTTKKEEEVKEQTVRIESEMYVDSATKFERWLVASQKALDERFSFHRVELLRNSERTKSYLITLTGHQDKINEFCTKMNSITS